jgi:hypothetical protein
VRVCVMRVYMPLCGAGCGDVGDEFADERGGVPGFFWLASVFFFFFFFFGG